ncbi:MAG: HEAT repeat domain-containing protein [bacterium]
MVFLTGWLSAFSGVGRAPSARAQGLLDQLSGRSPWAKLENPGSANRPEALETLLRTGGADLCEPLYQLYRDESPGADLRPAFTRALGALRCRAFLPQLIRLARSTRHRVLSLAAIEALGRLGDHRALPALLRLARTGQQPAAAVAALERLGPQMANPLGALLRQRGAAAPHAALALARLRAPGAAALLHRALAQQWISTPLALEALSLLGDRRSHQTLVPYLFSRDADTRSAALSALGRCAGPRAAGALLAVSGDDRLQDSALRLLGALAVKQPVSPLLTILGSKKATDRRAAVFTLGRVGRDDAVRPLTWLVQHGERSIRVAALLALQHTRSPGAATVLRRVARNGGPLAPYAALALGSLLRDHTGLPAPLRKRVDRAVRELAALSRGHNAPLARAALVALGRIRHDSGLPVALELLRSKDPRTRRVAAEAVGQFRSWDAVTPLIAVLKQDPDPIARGMAAWSLGTIGSHFAVEPLVAALDERTFPVAENAAAALRRLGLPSLGRRIARRLFHPSPHVRVNVAGALARLGYRGARARLTRLALRDPSGTVRCAAARALARIYGSQSRPLLQSFRSRELHPTTEACIRREQDRLRGIQPPRPVGATGRWVDFRLESGAGQPLPWRAYVLRLPDGLLKAGATDELGFGYAEQIQPGRADLEWLDRSFPPVRPKPSPAP